MFRKKKHPTRDITIWPIGGFGNNIFQIVIAMRYISDGYTVKLNTTLIEENQFTKFLGWKIHLPVILQITEELNLSFQNTNKKVKTWKSMLFFRLSKKLSCPVKGYFFAKDIESLEKFQFKELIGYFHSKDFLTKYKEEVKAISDILSEKSGDKDATVVCHFRWGDTNWGRENFDYYVKIRELIKEERECLVITDDPIKATEFFNGLKNIEIYSSDNPFQDFILFLNAQKIYVAPSTFSWWGSVLSKNVESIYIPKALKELLPKHIYEHKIQYI